MNRLMKQAGQADPRTAAVRAGWSPTGSDTKEGPSALFLRPMPAAPPGVAPGIHVGRSRAPGHFDHIAPPVAAPSGRVFCPSPSGRAVSLGRFRRGGLAEASPRRAPSGRPRYARPQGPPLRFAPAGPVAGPPRCRSGRRSGSGAPPGVPRSAHSACGSLRFATRFPCRSRVGGTPGRRLPGETDPDRSPSRGEDGTL